MSLDKEPGSQVPGAGDNGVLSLRVDAARWLNLAVSQNGIPIVRELSIEWKGSESLRNLELRVRSSPAFTQPFSLRLDRLDPTRPQPFQDLKIAPNHEHLAGLTEAFEGTLIVDVVADTLVLASESVSLRLLPADQWEGLQDLPELLAAHVQPNHPFVGQLLTRAGELLKSQGVGLSGYQQQSRDVVGLQIAAIYAAIRERDLVYVSAPASFHSGGQRIRLPDQIRHERLATCLDLAVLFAACLEQAGLHPLILMKEGHAWLGCWLDEGASCASPVDEDGQSLRKRRVIGELTSLELTLLTQKTALLPEAQRLGNQQLDDDSHFEAAVDIRLARQSGIRPIPLRIDGIFQIPVDAPAPAAGGLAGTLDIPQVPAPTEVDADAEPLNVRLERWKRKLLDISLRNKLINFKPTAKTLRILGTDLAKLEDALAAQRAFGFEVNPRFDRQKDPSSGQSVPEPISANRLATHVQGARERDTLVTLEEDKEKLDSRLTELFRNARTAEEENGASPLYLALGILEWKETERSSNVNRAPILLVPVSLGRSSVRAGLKGFKLSSREEDTRVNPTLLEKLRRDFGIAFEITDTPPLDESGVDVNRVLGEFRHLIVNRSGWEVKEEIWLGEFSFKKFLMWRDLQERETVLRAHPLVSQMLERPHTLMPSQGEFPNPRDLDATASPSEVFTPLVADSSQLTAIQAAAEGKSFVLEGPPGTGKSQTITNLIAHCMAHGKTVLFISEKKAALEVVRKRLVDVSLGAYCLEVHSDKARKTEIIEQLKAPLAPQPRRQLTKWQETTQALSKARQKLNEYVQALHHRFPCGLTIYEATGWLCQHPEARSIHLPWGDPHTSQRASLTELRAVVGEMQPLLDQLGIVGTHALRESALQDSSPLIEKNCKEQAEAARQALLQLDKVLETFARRIGITPTDLSFQEIETAADLANHLLSAGRLPAQLGQSVGRMETLAQLRILATRLKQRQELSGALGARYNAAFFSCDPKSLETLHQEATGGWWPKSWLRQRQLRRALRSYLHDGEAAAESVTSLPQAITNLNTVRTLDSELDGLGKDLLLCLGEVWRGPRTSASLVLGCVQWVESIHTILKKLGRLDPSRTKHLIEKTRELLEFGVAELRDAGRLATEFRAVHEAKDRFSRALNDLHATLQIDATALDKESPEFLAGSYQRLEGIRQALAADQLRFWTAWQRLRSQAVALGLQALIADCESATTRTQSPAQVLEASIRLWLVQEGLAASPALKNFIGQSQNQLIIEFRKLDRDYLASASAAAAARVDQRIPREAKDPGLDKEFALLYKELNKKSKHRPLRQLFAGMPGLMARLKPCLLMSPLSVAQHLDAEFPPFDMVVFDEASQIPVWDAIGAIARARQAIIVGDPKQMPPTAFFTREDDDDEQIAEAAEDLESILDETMTTLPVRRLEWHYRSRYESLITFSNRRYYDGRLVTFPSPVAEDRAVKLHRVDGLYDRGRSRTNRPEAEAVARFVCDHLRSPESAGQTLGVVTFNAQQQQLIENLLDNARREDPSLETHFTKAAGREEVFIKNLENVQGDERDVIIFSTTFGLDEFGKMSLHFGPINSANGPRRLNVAITRSRLAMHVFTSIGPEQLDTTRTTAVGVRHLKEFLDYAERGVDALRQATVTGDDAESPFEEAVATALRAHGWDVHHQIGCGGYRIDLGVVNPKAPGTYLAGIECDGASYHSGSTARDRDRLRQMKLEDLGWTLHRVWSTEWWRRPREETERLHRSLQEKLGQN